MTIEEKNIKNRKESNLNEIENLAMADIKDVEGVRKLIAELFEKHQQTGQGDINNHAINLLLVEKIEGINKSIVNVSQELSTLKERILDPQDGIYMRLRDLTELKRTFEEFKIAQDEELSQLQEENLTQDNKIATVDVKVNEVAKKEAANGASIKYLFWGLMFLTSVILGSIIPLLWKVFFA